VVLYFQLLSYVSIVGGKGSFNIVLMVNEKVIFERRITGIMEWIASCIGLKKTELSAPPFAGLDSWKMGGFDYYRLCH